MREKKKVQSSVASSHTFLMSCVLKSKLHRWCVSTRAPFPQLKSTSNALKLVVRLAKASAVVGVCSAISHVDAKLLSLSSGELLLGGRSEH